MADDCADKVDEQESSKPITKWTAISTDRGTPMTAHVGLCCAAVEEWLVFFGGYSSEGLSNSVNVYHLHAQMWVTIKAHGDIPVPRMWNAMVSDERSLIIFGGVTKSGRYSNSLYELETSTWNWRRIVPVNAKGCVAPPCPRAGHSLTNANRQLYLFGGIATDEHTFGDDAIRHLNDLYTLDLRQPVNARFWQRPNISGRNGPCGRHDHSAVFYDSGGRPQIIIYGGKCFDLLDDAWTLELVCMTWFRLKIHGIPPLPRMKHTANVIGDNMFIFGGYVLGATTSSQQNDELTLSNSLHCLNIGSLRWHTIHEDSDLTSVPRKRADHCSAVVKSRLYIWSGMMDKSFEMQIPSVPDDMWFLETAKPSVAPSVQLVSSSLSCLKVCWDVMTTAEYYVLQIQQVVQEETAAPVQPLKAKAPVSKASPAVRLQSTPTNAAPNNNKPLLTEDTGVKISRPAIVRLVRKPDGTMMPLKTSDGKTIIFSHAPSTMLMSKQKLIRFDEVPKSILSATSVTEGPRLIAGPAPAEADMPPVLERASGGTSGESTTSRPSPRLTTAFDEPSVKKFCEPPLPSPSGNAAEPPRDAAPPSTEAEGAPEVDAKPTAPWGLVGLLKKPWCTITSYFMPNDGSEEEPLPEKLDQKSFRRLVRSMKKEELKSSSTYRLRVVGYNTLGQGQWSSPTEFCTLSPEFPGPPHSAAVHFDADGAHLSWESPLHTAGSIVEYSAYVLLKRSDSDTSALLARVYKGEYKHCCVAQKLLNQLVGERTRLSRYTFRMAAKNENGYGPCLQLRWTEDV